MSFVIRTFDYSETLGVKLKALRRSANFTLTEMASRTKIQKSFLKALEEGRYSELPDPVYTRNFLRIYVRALEANETYFLEQFESECGTCDFMKNARLPRRRAQALQFLVASRFVKVFAVAAMALVISGYIGYQVRAIILPPELMVVSPSDGIMTDDAMIAVSGSAEPGTQVTINGQGVLLSQDGDFEVDIALERGVNVIIVESARRYSKPAVEYRRVVLEQDRNLSRLD
ncbi:MAG: helix-turn-helix domain-containing protein [bacterium]|jgi:transcriptional regulator with XRE-family HTH domain|nr:helix-turn-helix domain-containing protein [bacterium]